MAEPSPNTQFQGLIHDQWQVDNRSTFANGATGSIAPMELWNTELRVAELQKNWWQRFMKADKSSPIRFVPRPGSTGGAIVHLRGQGQLGGPGKMGDQLFAASADFGTIPLNSWPVRLENYSNATGTSRHTNEMLGMMEEFERRIPTQMGAWGGQKVCRHIDMTLMHKSAGTSRSIINGKATVSALRSADKPSFLAISRQSWMMREQGGSPFNGGKMANGEQLWNMMFPLPDMMAQSVKEDPSYISRLAAVGVRGGENSFFAGGLEAVDGNFIASRQIVIPQGQLASGSCWAPIAYLGKRNTYNATDYNGTPANTDSSLQGGGFLYDSNVTNTPFFADFPGYEFPFSQFETLALADSLWGSGPYYALIVNPLSDTVAPGAVGMISYTVPAGANTLVMTGRLHDSTAAGDLNETTIGSTTAAMITAGGATFTAEYAQGAAIIPCNAYGVPIGAMLGVGADAVGFVKGDMWGQRFTDDVQGGMSGKNVFAGWTFGLEPNQLPNGSTPGISVQICAVDYTGKYALPVMT